MNRFRDTLLVPVGAAQILAMALRYVLLLVIARVLSVEAFGAYSVVLNVVAMFSVLTMGGWPAYFLARIPKMGVQLRSLVSAYRAITLTCLVCGLAQFLVLGFLVGPQWSSRLGVWSVLVLLLMSMGTVANEAQRSTGAVVSARYAYAAVYPCVTLGLVLGLLLVEASPDVPAILAASSAGWCALWLVSTHKLRRRAVSEAYRLEATAVIEPRRRDFFWIKLAQAVLSSSDVLLVAWFTSLREAALYAVARRITVIAGLGLTTVTMLYGPRLSRVSGNPDRLRKETRRASMLAAGLSVPIIVGIAVLGGSILSTFGPGYVEAWGILLVLLVGSGANALAGPVGTVVNVNGQERFSRKVMCGAAALFLGAAPAALYWGGALGGALVWSVVTVVWNVVLWVGLDYDRGTAHRDG